MPATTPRGFPYPLPTEPVAEGAQAIRNLAEAIDTKEAGRELGYAENPAATIAAGVSEAAAAVVVTLAAITFDGSPVRLDFGAAEVAATGAGFVCWLYLFDGGTSLGILGVVRNTNIAVSLSRRMTPAAGAHTYSVRASQSGGACSILGGAGGLGVRFPAWMRASRV